MSGCYASSESKRDPGTSPFEVSALGRDEAEKVTEARRIVASPVFVYCCASRDAVVRVVRVPLQRLRRGSRLQIA
jgi:hypothetical protein